MFFFSFHFSFFFFFNNFFFFLKNLDYIKSFILNGLKLEDIPKNHLVWMFHPNVLAAIAARALLGVVYTLPLMKMANLYGGKKEKKFDKLKMKTN